MTYIYRFWHHLREPSSLTNLVEMEEQKHRIIGYKKALFSLLCFTLLLFITREVWGMYTSNLTELLAQGNVDRYVFARYMSLLGIVGWSLIYFFFHYYAIAYILSLLTDIPFKWIQKVQLYVILILLLEKTIEFFVFAIAKYTTVFSPFSSAAIFAQFTSETWLLYLINQLTLGTCLAIFIQFKFLKQWTESRPMSLLIKLIAIPVICALIVGYLSVSPIFDWVVRGLNE